MHNQEAGPNGFFTPIRVLIAEPQRLTRDAYRSLIQSAGHFDVVGSAGEMNTALNLTRALQPDIILLDINLAKPKLSQTVDSLRDKAPASKTLLIVTREWIPDASTFINQNPGVGFVPIESTGRELMMGLYEVYEHGFYLAAGAARHFFGEDRRGDPNFKPRVKPLTSREREVLQLLSDGKPNRDIAIALSISTRTVEAHKARMIARLGLHNTTELLRHAVITGTRQ